MISKRRDRLEWAAVVLACSFGVIPMLIAWSLAVSTTPHPVDILYCFLLSAISCTVWVGAIKIKTGADSMRSRAQLRAALDECREEWLHG